MSFYDSVAATANKILQQYGVPVTLVRGGMLTYDPATGQSNPGKSTSYQGIGVRANYSQQDRKDSLIEQGDQRVYLSAIGNMPLPRAGDTLLIAGASFTVIDSKPVQPAATPVLYEVQARGVS